MSAPESDEIRNDGALVNVITGLGVPTKDKTTATAISSRSLLTQTELEALYLAGVPRRYVDAIADTLLRHQVTIKLGEEDGADNQSLIKDFDTYLKDNRFHYALAEVIKLQRLYGGAGLVLLVDDGLDPAEPVNLSGIRSINGFIPLSRHELIPEDVSITDYSKPTYYRITTSQRLTPEQTATYVNVKIHNSRVARFDGLYLPWNIRSRNTGWGMSVLQLMWDAFKRYETAMSGLESMTSDSDLFVHKIPGLFQRLASGAEGDIRKRLEANSLSRSLYGGMVVDREEEVAFLNRALANISSASEPFIRDLQAVTGWPASILMGDSPGGLGKEGRFEERTWASLVEQWQEVYCRTPLTEIFTLIFSSSEGPTGGRLPDSWSVHFPSVFTETDLEKVGLRLQQAQIDSTYAGLGVINALEIRTARFGGTEFSIETPIDELFTERMAEQQDMQYENQLVGIATEQQNQLVQAESNATNLAMQQQQAAAPPEEPAPAPAAKSTAKRRDADITELGSTPFTVLRRSGKFAYARPAARLDGFAALPGAVLGPNSLASPIYRAVFDQDGLLTEGPYVLGFRLAGTATRAVEQLFPTQTVYSLRPLAPTEDVALREEWELPA